MSKNILVPFYNTLVNVTVTKEAHVVHNWICSLCSVYNRAPAAQILVGIDTEWLPNLSPDEDHPIAILQLCAGTECLVFQILHADYIPPLLHRFLADRRHIFCGVGVKDDVDKLYEHHGLRMGRTADLNDLVRMAGIDDGRLERKYRYMGLKKMALVLLGKKMEKPLNVTMSKWDADELDYAQIEYAAIDALVSFKLGYNLCLRIFNPNDAAAFRVIHPINGLVPLRA